MNPYDDILPFLHNNHFYPKKEIVVKKHVEVVTGLLVECSPLLKNECIANLKKILGHKWKVQHVGTEIETTIRLTKVR